MSGPFPGFDAKQWSAVRSAHRRFGEQQILERPLCLFAGTRGGWFSDVNLDDFSAEQVVLAGPRQRNAEMDATIRWFVQQAWALARTQHRFDAYPRVYIARKHYGHSQRLAEPFGTTTLVEGDAAAQAEPSITSLAQADHLTLRPVRDCPWLMRGREVLRYFIESTEGRYHIPHMVTTGPCDTINYVTGSTLFLEGLYSDPQRIHLLLRMATEVIIDDILACRRIAGDRLVPDHTPLLDGAFCICSEIRSQFSGAHYEEFEAPYLKQIGQAVGPLHVHVSGPIEQSLPGTLADPNIRHLKFWLKDCDLKRVVDTIGGRVSVDVFRNTAMPRLDFASGEAFYRHILENVRPETRWVMPTHDPDLWNSVCAECESAGTLPEAARRFGRWETS